MTRCAVLTQTGRNEEKINQEDKRFYMVLNNVINIKNKVE